MTEPTPAPLAADAIVVAVHDDAVERDGEMLVLVGTSEVVLLSAVAAALVTHARNPIDIPALTTRLTSDFGTPPDADPLETVRSLAGELVARGVLAQH